MPPRRAPSSLSTRLLLLGMLGMALLCLSGCAMQDDAALSADHTWGAESPLLLEARAALAEHQVDRAQSLYNQALARGARPPGHAYAGKAITDLLLLPGTPAALQLLQATLNAQDTFDANAALYADEGLLYWFARAVPWEDKGSYAGIRTLIARRLPWAATRLESARTFFDALERPLSLAATDLEQLADAMTQIEEDLARAVAAPDFDLLYIPGSVFHAEGADLLLGAAELHLISGLVSLGRAAIYFAAAYDFEASLDALLGSQRAQRETPRSGWDYADYAWSLLDEHLLRAVASPARLGKARAALEQSLTSFIRTIEVGQTQSVQTSLRWQNADPGYTEALGKTLRALRAALHEPTLLPGATPPTTLDLRAFFDTGRTLDPAIPWFERHDTTPGTMSHAPDAATAAWELRPEATRAFLIEDVFHPPFDPDQNPPTLAATQPTRLDAFVEDVFGPVLRKFAASY